MGTYSQSARRNNPIEFSLTSGSELLGYGFSQSARATGDEDCLPIGVSAIGVYQIETSLSVKPLPYHRDPDLPPC